ncbi:MAG: SGNH/GDSL hydrolase family protein [Desulfomonile tiedjei]|nr:SGNH/GDSL hydrolase family protein [Desulfomonile tiedjei]
MKQLLRWTLALVKWIVLGILCIELLSFLAVSATNFIMYGHAREGSRAVYDPYTLFLQSSGVRPTVGNSVAAESKKNRTVWMFGGSTMRGTTDFDEWTIPSFLSDYLNSNPQGLHFSVTNFGVNSFNSLLETKYLQKLLIESPSQPDLIIFYDGANDAKYFLEHRTAYGHHGYRRTRALIESYYHSWFGVLKPLNAAFNASFTKELYDRINQVAVPLDPGSTELRQMVAMTEKRYDFVNKMSACFGAKFILFWQPMLWVEDCAVSGTVKDREKNAVLAAERFATMRHNFSVTYNSLADRLAEKPYFVSFRGVFCDRQVPVYQPDGVHLTDDGRKIVAKAMGKVLEQRFFK